MSSPALVVFLRSPDWEARWLAASAALSAAAIGASVRLALSGEPLRAFVEGRFDEGEPPRAAAVGAGGLAQALAEARVVLDLRVVACGTAVRLAGLDTDHVVPPLDELVSLPELVRHAMAGSTLSF